MIICGICGKYTYNTKCCVPRGAVPIESGVDSSEQDKEEEVEDG